MPIAALSYRATPSPPPPEPVSDAELDAAIEAGRLRARRVFGRYASLSLWGRAIGPRTRRLMGVEAIAVSERAMAGLAARLAAGTLAADEWERLARAETATHVAALAWLRVVGSELGQ